jgi:hypothetical protein
VLIDRAETLRFLCTGYEPDDWLAVFLKSYATGRVAQRTGPLSVVTTSRFQEWLERENHARVNVYVSVNAIRAHSASRRRSAIAAVRHVFVEADDDGDHVVATITARPDLPPPSYVLHSSPDRVHVLWRVTGFTTRQVEALQKQLAGELGTDRAATPCSQTTRLPGFFNHKYQSPHLVRVDYGDTRHRYDPKDFPAVRPAEPLAHPPASPAAPRRNQGTALTRAQAYLSAVPPAIAGQHGDLHTFRVCCRLVRGFALADVDALSLLVGWNGRCEPPWSERELLEKLRRAHRYGREPMGGLLEGRS